jgi:peptidoglycan hydrolase-like protein with peptidoglycan-binding domain
MSHMSASRHFYVLGSDVLGEDIIPSAGLTYTDAATVHAVQTYLKAKGYDLGPGGVDGLWGKDTAKAVKKLQLDRNIPQTGVIDSGVLIATGVSVPTGAPARAPAPTPAATGMFAAINPPTPTAMPAGVTVPPWKIGLGVGAGALFLGALALIWARR